ncbi:hypothetical protein Aca07nite_01450 [Actinoplanes capillaceus]|uniref:Uncharacterized protein n=1 Tax=Actinoplanes campanulatus TaxID=113559 RepID=A0ABQ3W9A3_9ACTN|nr:hypothetical protein Aca07nite_01450 [Actinoplanes capillaceus]
MFSPSAIHRSDVFVGMASPITPRSAVAAVVPDSLPHAAVVASNAAVAAHATHRATGTPPVRVEAGSSGFDP